MNNLLILLLIYIIYTTSSSFIAIPPNLENYIVTQRFLNSPLCFSYQDLETGRTYFRTLDWDRFSSNNLLRCYPASGSNLLAYRLTLEIPELSLVSSPIETKNWADNNKRRSYKENVQVMYNNKAYNGKLNIELQNEKQKRISG